MPIASLDDLRRHLRWAIQAEHLRTAIPGTGRHAGPAFGYSTAPRSEIAGRCRKLATSFPVLDAVAQALRRPE